MAVELFDPQLIIARLDSQVDALKLVAGAADFASAMQEPPRILPATYVLELGNRAAANSLATIAVSQENTVRFGVIFAVQNLRDPRGEKAHTDLRTVRSSVMTALLGWAPDPDYDVVEYGGGQLLALENLVLWWQDEYLTRILERSV